MKIKSLLKLFIILILFMPLSLFSQTTFTSVATGNWGSAGTWDQGAVPSSTDNVVISTGHTVTVNLNSQSVNNLDVESNGVINVGTKGLTINGNLIVNGTYTGSKELEFTGGLGQTIDGIGVIKVNFMINGNTQILSTANLSVIASIFLANGVTLTNSGRCTITYDLRASDAAGKWINETNSLLQLSDELFPTHGILEASAVGNTVIYNSDVNNQNVKTPSGFEYYNIELTGIKEKRVQDNITVSGNVKINSGIFVSNNNTITVIGNWESYAQFDEGTGTVIFSGNNTQSIIRPAGEQFFNLEINKSGGILNLEDNVIVTNTLTMTSGNINAGTKKITLGTDLVNLGTLIHVSGSVIGKFERWVDDSASSYDFPVGTQNYYRPANITFSKTINTGGSMIFEFVEENPGNNGLSLIDGLVNIYNTFVDGYWSSSIANGLKLGSTNYNLVLTGTNFGAFTIDAETRILIRDDASLPWTTEGTHGINTPPNVQRTGLTTTTAHFSFGDDTNCTPPSTSAITGTVDLCSDALGEIYSVTNSPGSSYYWTINGGTQASGGNTNSISVDWSGIGMLGSVSVQEHNGCTLGDIVNLDVNLHTIDVADIIGKENVHEFTLNESYSVSPTAGYTYNWTVTGGTIVAGQGTSSINIDWGVAGTGNIEVVAQYGGCADASPYNENVNIYYVVNSAATGDWDDPATWDCNCIPLVTDNARILNTHTVTLTGNEKINHFNVDAGGVLDMQAKTFFITGDVTIDGAIIGSNDISLEQTGNIDGTGTINSGDIKILGNKTILSTAVLTVSSGNVDLNNIYSYMVTNYGNITVANDIIGKSAASKYWTNQENSTLNIGGVLLATGDLIAEAQGNTVNYYGGVAQTIKNPDPTTNGYWNLKLSGYGVKTPEADLDVNGDLTILEVAVLDVQTTPYNINLAGDWLNYGTAGNPFWEGSTTETVTFDGNSDQYIIRASTETFNNFFVTFTSNTIIKSGSSVTVNGETNITGTLTLESPNNDSGISGSFIDNGTVNVLSTGRMSANRYINAYQWHEISSPVSAGNGDNTTAVFTRTHSVNFNPNLFRYNETVDLDGNPATEPTGAFDNNNLVPGWTYGHNGSAGADDDLVENVGYMFYTTEDQMINFEGTPATGNFDVTGLSFTNNDPDDDGDTYPNLYDGWHLLGNPYPSSINWDLIRDDQLINVDDGVYVWDNNQYAGYQNGISVMSGNLTNHIPPMQAFFVHANAPGGEVQIRNEHRTHGATQYLKNTEPVQDLLKLKTSANNFADYFAVYFREGATVQFDSKFDLLRMFSNNSNVPELFTRTVDEQDPLALSCLPMEYMKNGIIPLSLKVKAGSNYNISVEELNLPNVNVYLKDNYENKTINLKLDSQYNINHSGGEVSDRLFLVFKANISPVVLNKISDKTAYEDSKFHFTFNEDVFFDSDTLENLSYSARLSDDSSLPQWLSFNSETRTFFGTPSNSETGVFVIKLTVSDACNATISTEFVLNVINTNDAPILNKPLKDYSFYNNEIIEFFIPDNAFVDIDPKDELFYKATGSNNTQLPDGLFFNKENKQFIGQIKNPGLYEIEVTATDIAGEKVSDIFIINIKEAFTYTDNISEIEFNVTPNPNNGVFTLEMNPVFVSDNVYVHFTDVTGKRIFSKQVSESETYFDLRNFSSGIYFAEIVYGNNEKQTIKIIYY